MTKNELIQEALKRLGFETIGQVSYGTWKGFAVSLHPISWRYAVEIAVRLEKQSGGSVVAAVRKATKVTCPKGIKALATIKNGLRFESALNSKEDYEPQLTVILDAAVNALRQNGVEPADTCAVCGASGVDSNCLIDTFQPVHAACVRNLKEDTIAAAERNENQGSYLLGIIGAILGMLLGLIPNVLSIVFGDRIWSLLFALVPLAAMFGYRKLKGKQNAAAIVIVVILSLIGVVVLECIINCIYLMQEYQVDFGAALSAILQFLFTGEGIAAFVQDGLELFLFMALGIFISWRYVFQTNQTHVASMDAVTGTLRPLTLSDSPAETEEELTV